MRSLYLTCLAAVVILGCSNEREKHVPEAKTTQATSVTQIMATIPTFNGNEAFTYLTKQTSFGPRNPGSPGHARCLEYLSSTLGRFADEVRLQKFEHVGYAGEKLHLTNVLAVFNPSATARVLFCSHWDTRPRAERDEDPLRRDEPIIGANDGASGVAVLLELAALIKSQPPAIGVDILLVDGEDYGKEGDQTSYLLGSRYFASNLPAGYAPRYGILLDMIGDASLELPKEQNSIRYAPDIVSLVWGKARDLGIAQFLDANGEEVLDDHIPLNQAGIKTIDLIDFNYPDESNRYWHTHQDTPEHCSAGSLEAVGTVLTHVLYSERL